MNAGVIEGIGGSAVLSWVVGECWKIGMKGVRWSREDFEGSQV